jgi:hypothetical protein
MSIEARVHAEVVYHDKGTATFTVGAVTDHIYGTPIYSGILTAVATTAISTIPVVGNVTTIGLKNTGSTPILVNRAISVLPSRLAVLPVTATISVSTASGASSYTAVWIGDI